jgi:predicted dienelactone hydrolase
VKQRHGDQLEHVASSPAWMHDTRIKVAVIAAPALGFLFESGGLKQVSIPVELWRASDDHQAPDAWNSGVVRKELPRSPEEHVVPGVDHFVFLAPCSSALAKAAPSICEDPSGFSREEFHDAFNRTVITFFIAQLNR